MSKLDELIKELCPSGVEYKKLGEVTKYSDTRINNSEIKPFSYVGVENLLQQKKGVEFSFKIPEGKNSIEYLKDDILIGNIRPYLRKIWKATKNGGTNGDVLVIRILTGYQNKLNAEYLYYLLSSEDFFIYDNQHAKGAKMPRGSKDDIMLYEIPVPPLQVQNEIVRILDKFTSLEAELEAELEARRKQYEYYRDSLLTFGDVVEWKSLDELCTKVTDGSHFSPKAVEQGYPMPSVKDMRYNCFDLTDCKRISQSDYDTLVKAGCKPQINDVVIAKDGSMLKYAFAIKENLDLVILSSIAILKPKTNIINPDFFAHYFRQESFRELVIRDYSSKGGVPRIVLKNFKKIKIPVPTLEKQLKIVAILDRFESLCNDITSGLPAEIAARHKQYEYYRDKLLTFKRKEG